MVWAIADTGPNANNHRGCILANRGCILVLVACILAHRGVYSSYRLYDFCRTFVDYSKLPLWWGP